MPAIKKLENKPRVWTAEQLRFMEWLAMSRFVRTPPTQDMLAAEIGVSAVTLWAWKQLPGFSEKVNDIIQEGLGHKRNEVYAALIREAEAGSYHHIKLFLELTGDYQRVQRNINENSGETTVRFVWGDAQPVGLLEDDDDVIDGEYAEDD